MQRATAIVVTLGLLSPHALAEAGSGAAPGTICGRPADMVQLVIDMQKETVETLWRGGKLYINRDTTDGSLWGFSMPHSTVHPATYCRRTIAREGEVVVETGQICLTGENACESFAQQVVERMDKLEAAAQE